MAVFRIEKTRDYTVMANHHLRNTALSLKAKGLLSLMLSLPEDWDYTTKGLARICRDGVDSICATVRELEDAGYIIRERVRNANGRLGSIEYTILEQPRPPEPKPGKPERENPVQVKPVLDSPVLGKPEQENHAQLNTKGSSKQISNTDSPSTEESNPIQSSPKTPTGVSRTGRDWMRERESYRELILENIEYDYLCRDDRLDRDMLNELVELMVDTVCSRRETIRIAGDDYPAEVVKSRFLKLNSSHIEYVLDRMRENTTYVRNIKKYLLAALYNAPATIDSYYASLVNHDLYGSGEMPDALLLQVRLQPEGQHVGGPKRQKIHYSIGDEEHRDTHCQRHGAGYISLHDNLPQEAIKVIIAGDGERRSRQCQQNADTGKGRALRDIGFQFFIDHITSPHLSLVITI